MRYSSACAWRTCLFVIAFLGSTTYAIAADAPLTLEQAIAAALQKDPRLQTFSFRLRHRGRIGQDAVEFRGRGVARDRGHLGALQRDHAGATGNGHGAGQDEDFDKTVHGRFDETPTRGRIVLARA